MTLSGAARTLCVILAAILAVPSGFAQATPAPATPAQAIPAQATPGQAVPAPAPSPLTSTLGITVLEGKNAVNSIPLLRSVAPVVEIRDSNDFPVEGAAVVFTLPQAGTGGTFAGGSTSFSTRSDSHGQAAAPPVVPKAAGKFQINVAASIGDRKGEIVISQTNSAGTYSGPPLASRPFYKRKLTWLIAGGAVAAIILVIVFTHHSGSSSGNEVVITPGAPVFQ
jgi:hypothetical protein